MKVTIDPLTGLPSTVSSETKLISVSSGGGGSGVKSVVAGTNVTVDNTDPSNPIVSSTGGGGGGSGTVTSVSVTTANGVSGSVATATTTPAISLSLGNITPTSVNSVVVSGSSTPTLAVTGTSTVSGTNTGDQTTITGNAGTATTLQTSRTIGTLTGDVTSAGSSFNGSANNTNATVLATVNSNVGSFTKASLTVNAKGLITAASSGTPDFITSITTTGTSGPATVSSGVLNVPQYSGGGGGSGDVVGPASATDNAITRFDTTTGKLVQNSTVLVNDAGSFTLPAISAPTYAAGQLYYDSTEDALSFQTGSSSVTANIAQENLVKVTNNTGSTIANGVPVYINGQASGVPTVALSGSTTFALSQAIGLTTESIANGASGYVATYGKVRGIDTSAFTAGATLYVGATAGTLTSTAPTTGSYTTKIGTVLVSNAVTGIILVTPQPQPGHTTQATAFTMTDGVNITLGTTTGNSIGSAATEKLSFYGGTPIVRPTASTDLGVALSNLNLRTAGATYTLTTSGATNFTGSNTFAGFNASTGAVVLGGAGFRSAAVARTASVSLVIGSGLNNLCNATTASFTLTLPAANAASGQTFWFKKTDATANTVTIARAGTDTIDGATSYVLSTQYKYVEIVSDGTSVWYVRGNN